jgi:predicted nucleic acid-binding protein
MVVVDASALIPLAWVGELDLITTMFDGIRTTEEVRDEVLTKGKRGTSVLDRFLENVTIHQQPANATEMASVAGIAVADASVILLAEGQAEVLLANDKGLIEVARSHDVECWWVTTLLLRATADGVLTSVEATEMLYALVDEGMNLHPRVYAQLQKSLKELDT